MSHDLGGRIDWRPDFGEAWADLTTGARGERRTSPEDVWVLRALRRAGRMLHNVLDRSQDVQIARESALSAAALALEAATAAHPTCPPIDAVRMSLLDSVERLLDIQERQILTGQDGYRITAARVRDVTSRADRAALRLRAPSCQARPYLAELDQTAVELAALAIRIAVNLDAYERPSGPPRSLPPVWCARLATAVRHIERAATRAESPGRWAGTSRSWVRAAMDLTLPGRELDAIDDSFIDRNLRAEALTTIRALWVRRAGYELRIIEPLKPFAGASVTRQRRAHEIAALAGVSLIDGQLMPRPHAFLHQGAWAANDQLLTEALATARSRHRSSPSTSDRLRRAVLGNVARAAVAASLIDGVLDGAQRHDL